MLLTRFPFALKEGSARERYLLALFLRGLLARRMWFGRSNVTSRFMMIHKCTLQSAFEEGFCR